MYDVYLNIGSFSSPSIGGGWVASSCIVEQASVVKQEESYPLVLRKSLNGTLVFLGDEYTALKTLSDAGNLFCGIKIEYDSTEQVNGDLELTGMFNTRLQKASLGFIINDKYTKIINNLDKEFTFPSGFTSYVVQSFTPSVRTRGQAV